MTVSLVRAGTWLLVQAAQFPDTVLMRQVGQERGWFEKITAVASGLMTLALLVLAVALVPAAWNFRKSYAKVSNLLDRVYGDINPIMRHASAIADNIDFVTTSIRTDVQKVNATIASANEKVQEAVSLTERRLHELNALLRVVQDEAEEAFLSTASALRGVRTGAAAFHYQGGMDLASAEADSVDEVDEVDDVDDLADELADERTDDTEREEEGHGYDGSRESAAEALAAAPRVRPRAGRRRRA